MLHSLDILAPKNLHKVMKLPGSVKVRVLAQRSTSAGELGYRPVLVQTKSQDTRERQSS